MTQVYFSPLLALDTRFWVGQALAVHDDASALSSSRLQRAVRSLALEVRENIQALRSVDAHESPTPSLHEWASTVALLLFVSPRLALRLAELFGACLRFRLSPYLAIVEGIAFVLGAVLTFAAIVLWRRYGLG